MMINCPCNPAQAYADCCSPFHGNINVPVTAEQLMRSRYSAFVLERIDYIVATTLPAQQALLDVQAIQQWSQETQWHSLCVHSHTPHCGKCHARVDFEAFFVTENGLQSHREHSAFVHVDGRWYFIDPMPMQITQKQSCICTSGHKYKHCCGLFR